MSTSLVQVLRKTLIVVEQSEEFGSNDPAILKLRRDLARTIGELEVAKAFRPSSYKPIDADTLPKQKLS